MKSGGKLETILTKGVFAVTAQLGLPKGSDVSVIEKKAESLKENVDAINIPDNQLSVVRMCSMAGAAILVRMGFEPIMHMVTRDRNRIAMQSDLLGATALGIKNVFCVTGDHQSIGNQTDSKNVHDLDSVQLIDCLRTMRDRGTLLGGVERIERPLGLFIGGAANPFADPLEFRVIRLAKKVHAGVDFIQTQSVYDMNRFKEWMGMVRDRGLHESVHIMAGVTPLKSAEMARSMNEKIPGMTIPETVIDRMERAQKPDEEGIRICVEFIEELKAIQGVQGVHVTAVNWENRVGQIVEMAGLLPRPMAT
jgi:methylenetetrahydrofolate reductase (NADPH)